METEPLEAGLGSGDQSPIEAQARLEEDNWRRGFRGIRRARTLRRQVDKDISETTAHGRLGKVPKRQ
jgi:hypothetical protein